jgi:hypothetical protein
LENAPILATPHQESGLKEKVGAVAPLLSSKLQVPSDKLITKLSYSHLELFLNIDEPLKRTFCELECIKGTWSVRELKLQINSFFDRREMHSKF